MRYFDSSAWMRRLESEAVLPEGFQAAAASMDFVPAEKPDAGKQNMNLAVIRLEEPTVSFAGVFTRNAFPGWPVVAGRRLLDAPAVQGLLVNNRVANVGAAGGLEDSQRLSRLTAELSGAEGPYFQSSTGVIGWKLPITEMEAVLPGLCEAPSDDSLLPFARAIMTTDAWPKIRSSNCGGGRIVATAKGAGMVEPDMATMLAFFLTDVDIPRDIARRMLPEVVANTFNRISIDGEMSTSDTVLFFSSRRKPYPGDAEFRRSLTETAAALSEDVVRNGEGCGHVIKITVSGLDDEIKAASIARSIANAPLTKTAVRGNDPNVGRIIQALGAACGGSGLDLNRDVLELSIGDEAIYGKGRFLLNEEKEASLIEYLKKRELPVPPLGWPPHEECVQVTITLGDGRSSATVIGSDLSEEYVKINADYRT
ncbi:MAG: bifunctional ornithine acetyltransferase/N-acetylglutamate synthase [Spirochaetaceae bacterium]|nr:bifunctional ornithine acetyltransferase/N-acetylglutamate synthase [Spirochaetaceae bacterium]MDT8297480.1 bifunctional ornithine acetyltransferase/N-acetylglutamate synthase [Spirochaetaceae bacterium]